MSVHSSGTMSFKALFLALAAALPLTAAACGPEFPAELLRDRAATLNLLPEGAFNFEAQHLVAAPAAHFPVVEHADWIYQEQKVTTQSIERGWWGEKYERINALRAAPTAAAAYAAGAGLAEEVRRYLAGAAAFAKQDFGEARKRFRSVLDLPAGDRTHYGLWAQYMLGRTAVTQSDNAAAIAAFVAVRNDVTQGAEDPLGLASTSLGDEARVHRDAGDDAAAIALYAQQAALGSAFARASLLWTARDIVNTPERLDRILTDPLGQRLITAYLFTRSGELSESPDGDNEGDDTSSDPPATAAAEPDRAALKAQADARIDAFLAAVERKGLDKIAGADRLAALAYRRGKYDLAGKLAAKDDGGLSYWVRAKLALRAGDANAAAQAYAQAAKSFPKSEEWGTSSDGPDGYSETIKPYCRVEGEHGTLALSRGEYTAAMEHLFNAADLYWPDAAYVAERVLTVDELKAFIDTHVAKAPTKPAAEAGVYGIPASLSTSLRALLARRLLRAERFDEALAYFDDAALQAKARKYVDARRAATADDRIGQAKAWYTAAVSARVDGIDLLGYELDPDYQMYGGDYDLGHPLEDATGNPVSAQRSDLAVPAKLAGPDEAKRVAASVAQPLKRFHYRYNAVDYASKSADLLPPRTQAFAAVLCHATAWVINRDPALAHSVYARYVKQGPYVPWGDQFGQECPEPDFKAAAARLHAERVRWWKHTIRHNAPYAVIGAGLLLFVIWLLRRQRKAKV